MTISLFSLPLVFLSLLSSSFCLLLKNVTVPPFKLGGGSASLGCDFDPQGEQVYSVKWYKGGQEIFRYLPSNKLHPVAVFSRPGVTIDEVIVICQELVFLNLMKFPFYRLNNLSRTISFDLLC